MQYDRMLLEEKGKLLPLIKKKYMELNFSDMAAILENNILEPLWMDVYILIYKCNFPPDIKTYDILLNKLSMPIFRVGFIHDNKMYVANINERMISRYVWYRITDDTTPYFIETQYLPKREYYKEVLKFNKFSSAGIGVENVDEDKFKITPTNYEFTDINEASIYYNKLLDAFDVYRSLKLDIDNFTQNIDVAIKYGKDKRMVATLSNILTYFDLKFIIKNGNITMDGLDYIITNEADADKFQVKLIDAYQFFRNVMNTENKRDIVSEIYNKKLKSEIRKEFEENVVRIFKLFKNQELVDWVITISKESKYTLDIKFDDQGVFFIDNHLITNAAEAKEFYIDYMDKKKEKLSMTVYKNNILTKIKNIWNKFRARFVKI